MAHVHKEVRCKQCKRKVTGCGCPDINKPIEWITECVNCAKNRIDLVREQRERIMADIGKEVIAFETKNRIAQDSDKTQSAFFVLNLLVDARLEIENLKKGNNAKGKRTQLVIV